VDFEDRCKWKVNVKLIVKKHNVMIMSGLHEFLTSSHRLRLEIIFMLRPLYPWGKTLPPSIPSIGACVSPTDSADVVVKRCCSWWGGRFYFSTFNQRNDFWLKRSCYVVGVVETTEACWKERNHMWVKVISDGVFAVHEAISSVFCTASRLSEVPRNNAALDLQL
jgi:hypothetical protein